MLLVKVGHLSIIYIQFRLPLKLDNIIIFYLQNVEEAYNYGVPFMHYAIKVKVTVGSFKIVSIYEGL